VQDTNYPSLGHIGAGLGRMCKRKIAKICYEWQKNNITCGSLDKKFKEELEKT
jgi:hypothetical protein